MSGEQRKPPRPAEAVSSHMRPLSLEALNETVGSLIMAQQGTTLAVQDLTTAVGKHDTLITDLLTRLTPVEQATKSMGQKVGSGAIAGVKYTVYITAAVAILNALSKQWPFLADIAHALGSLGL